MNVYMVGRIYGVEHSCELDSRFVSSDERVHKEVSILEIFYLSFVGAFVKRRNIFWLIKNLNSLQSYASNYTRRKLRIFPLSTLISLEGYLSKTFFVQLDCYMVSHLVFSQFLERICNFFKATTTI